MPPPLPFISPDTDYPYLYYLLEYYPPVAITSSLARLNQTIATHRPLPALRLFDLKRLVHCGRVSRRMIRTLDQSKLTHLGMCGGKETDPTEVNPKSWREHALGRVPRCVQCALGFGIALGGHFQEHGANRKNDTADKVHRDREAHRGPRTLPTSCCRRGAG